MRQISDYFCSAVDRPLYHYTSISGLMGMVESRSVWASHAYYLNDSREIIHAVDALARKIDKYVSLLGMEDDFSTQFLSWLDSFRHTPYHIFVYSLSEERSLLSQWRSYTPHGRGVSIGFTPSTINYILRKPGFRLAQCLYTSAEHESLLAGLMEKLLVTFQRGTHPALNSSAHSSQSLHPFFESFRNDFLQVLAIVKHEEFREEREWRILSPYYRSYVGSEVKFRIGASMILPYTVLELPPEGPLFDQVVLGPSHDEALSMSALATYLSNKQVCNTTLNCNIPYRQWAK